MDNIKKLSGMNIGFDNQTLEFTFNDGTMGHGTEKRKLEDIRKSLLDPSSTGPEFPYSVAMDVYNNVDEQAIIKKNLLYGIMFFSSGQIGQEPIRSQGHIHAISKSTNFSTCEVYQIIEGTACILMQEFVADNTGRSFAVIAKKGEIVIVPPGWAHATINYDFNKPMFFGAWCIRDFGFEYKEIRSRNGLAFYPLIENKKVKFIKNNKYEESKLITLKARSYKEIGIITGKPIYDQFKDNNNLFDFVTNPKEYNKDFWEKLLPSLGNEE